MFRTVFEQTRALTSRDGKPLIVLAATESLRGDILRWESSHSPFLSRPHDVAELLGPPRRFPLNR